MTEKPFSEADVKILARRIAHRILSDVTDRRGWRQEWANFDEDVQREIRERHVALVAHELNTYPEAKAPPK